MAYKTIIVNLEVVKRAEPLMKAAVQLAAKHDAHLIGTYIVQPVSPYVGFHGDLSVSVEIDKLLVKQQNAQIKELKAIFDKATGAESFVSEWRSVTYALDTASRSLLALSGRADLLIVGSAQALKSDAHRYERDALTTVICGSACPVLVIPETYDGATLGDDVVLAYDAGRESSRAIFSAIPLLKTASNVWLHRISSTDDDDAHMDDSMRDMADNLSRHGIKPELSTSHASPRKVGKRLTSVTIEHAADCLVMGAPSHGKMRDLLLGSAARHMLKKSKVPILFAA